MKWAKGISGNIKGRPPGSENKSTRLRHLIGERVPEILDKLIEAAIGGDMTAAKILIDRAIPPLRPESLPVNIALPDKASLVDIGKLVIQSISEGSISADQGAHVLSVLSNQAKLIEVIDLEQRIKALEEASNSKS